MTSKKGQSAGGKRGKRGMRPAAAAAENRSPAGKKPVTPQVIIRQILKMSQGETYIFRGEDRRYEKPVSSSLYRELCLRKRGGSPIMSAQYFATLNEEESMVKGARRHIASDHLSNIDIVTLLQHHGCPTAHIDFSDNMFIGVFHACGGADEEVEARDAAAKAGIVYIFAERLFHRISGDISYNGEEQRRDILIKSSPREPRALSQSSLFVRAYQGFLEPGLGKQVIIPHEMKRAVLDYLKKNLGISEQTVYFDIHGFIAGRSHSLPARQHLHEGLECHAEGEYNRALACYDEAAKLRPEWAIIYYNRGLTWYEKGDYRRAIKDYNEAIRLEPDLEKAYINRGIAKKKGDPDGAIADFNRAICINPQLAEAYIRCGQVKIDQGDYDDAIADLNQAIRINPEWLEAYISRGTAKKSKGKLDDAIADYSRAILVGMRLLEAWGFSGITKSGGIETTRVAVGLNELIHTFYMLLQAYDLRGAAKKLNKDHSGAGADSNREGYFVFLLSEAYMIRGAAKYRKRYIDGGRKDFEKALSLAEQQGDQSLCGKIRRRLARR